MKNLIVDILTAAISFLDSFRPQENKLTKSHLLNGIRVKSDSGFSPAAYIHLTKKYQIYTITTVSGLVLKCADEHLIFDPQHIQRWVTDYKVGDQILTEHGPDTITSIEKSPLSVSMCDLTVLNQDESYYTNGILSHNTTTSALFMLHYILFNVDKNALVLGNKRKTAVEILDKAKKIFTELPYFLRPGVYKWNEGEIALDNGCRLMAEATTINSGISFTFHCVLSDEFAHIQPNIMDKFYNNLFPTITAGKSRFMITSTQNGYNLFYRLCKAAELHENEYAFFKTDWDEVPEWDPDTQSWVARDEEWHRMQVANYGSEEAFNAQFGTSFDVKTNNLIDNIVFRRIEKKGVEFVRKEMHGVSHSDSFFWHPEYDIDNMRNDYFVITTDISEGISKDYTVYMFNKLKWKDSRVQTETIGYFQNNNVNAQQATTILKEFCQNYLDINRYLVSLEYNLYGELFAKYIIDTIEKDPANAYRYNEDIIMKYWNDEMTRYTLGKKISSKTKQYGTAMFKQLFEKEEICNYALQFLTQLSLFCDSKGNGTYAASFGHDDLVMAQLQMVYVRENPQYESLCRMFIAENQYIEDTTSYNPYNNDMDPNNGSFNSYDFPDSMNPWNNGYSDPYSF